jgi:hypothetical protein
MNTPTDTIVIRNSNSANFEVTWCGGLTLSFPHYLKEATVSELKCEKDFEVFEIIHDATSKSDFEVMRLN